VQSTKISKFFLRPVLPFPQFTDSIAQSNEDFFHSALKLLEGPEAQLEVTTEG